MPEKRSWMEMKEMAARVLKERTGEDLNNWVQRIESENFTDEKSLRDWLASQGVVGYPQMFLVMERFGYPDHFLASADDLIEDQYADRTQLWPIYTAIIATAVELGEFIIQARKTYVSLVTSRRTFARIQPTTKNRIDIGLRLEKRIPEGRLVPSNIHPSMPLQLSLHTLDDWDAEAIRWFKLAFEQNQ